MTHEQGRAPKIAATYYRSDEVTGAGEALFIFRFYINARLEGTAKIPASMLHEELRELREQGYTINHVVP